jgi:hypothetical protein
MRIKEKDAIFHYRNGLMILAKQTRDLQKWNHFYSDLLKDMLGKMEKLYLLFGEENDGTERQTRSKSLHKDKLIRKVMKLRRIVAIAGIQHPKAGQLPEYSYSDFIRPKEPVRMERIKEVVVQAKKLNNPDYFGISKKDFTETIKMAEEYLRSESGSISRKKERAQQAKQCRVLLKQLNFLKYRRLKPFFENIKDDFPTAWISFNSFMHPVKQGRPRVKKVRKKKSVVVQE